MDDTLVPLGMFAMVAFIVWIKTEGARRRQLQATEFHAKLLERMSSAREFGEFLGTDAGARFLESISTGTARPADRLLRFVQSGITLLAIGVGLLIASLMRSTGRSEGLLVGGIIVTAVGIGSLLSAAISYRLLPHLGLTERQKPLSDGQL